MILNRLGVLEMIASSKQLEHIVFDGFLSYGWRISDLFGSGQQHSHCSPGPVLEVPVDWIDAPVQKQRGVNGVEHRTEVKRARE